MIWDGQSAPPLQLQGFLTPGGIEVVALRHGSLAELAPRARAVVVEVPQDDPTFALRFEGALASELDHGLTVFLVWERPGEAHCEDFAERAKKFWETVQKLPGFSRTLVRFNYLNEVAAAILSLSPTRMVNQALRMIGDVPEDPACHLLLRRAFCDYAEIDLKVLLGGRSGASAFLVYPTASSGRRRAYPYVAKIHAREITNAERSAAIEVRERISSQYHAPILGDRYADGNSLGLIVYEVIEDGQPLRQAVRHFPEDIIQGIFTHTLKGFLTERKTYHCTLGHALEVSDGLREASHFAHRNDAALPTAEEVIGRFRSLAAMEHQRSPVHGDFHAGNLFVPVNTREVMMIDYGSWDANAPLILDVACLEVSLTFPPEGGSQSSVALPPAEWLRHVYTEPLSGPVPSLAGEFAWLSRAVAMLRAHGVRLEPNREPYAAALARYLLRTASFVVGYSQAARSLAYELGCRILCALKVGPESGR